MANGSWGNLQNRTIVVYGASSNIGRRFIQEAAKLGATVIAVARNTNKITYNLKRGIYRNIKIEQGDITRKIDVRRVLKGRKVYATINFATDFSSNRSTARRVNVRGEQLVMDASYEFGVNRHIYISTVATQASHPSTYRDTKLEAEKIVKIKGGKYHIDWIILRFANVLGTRAWDQPFKVVLPYFRLAVPKVPTDAKNAVFYFVTIKTAIETILAALDTRPNQIITVFDGKVTIGEYLSVMEKVSDIKRSYLPSKPIKLLAKYLGKYFSVIKDISAGFDFMIYPPSFENKTMKKELKVKTRNFQKWIKNYSSQIE